MPSMRSLTAPAPSPCSPRLPRRRGARLTTPASASTCTGRSAPPSAPTATSTAMCAPAASTRRASCAAFLRELGTGPRWRRAARVGSIFFGGGTPSLMSAAHGRRHPRCDRAAIGRVEPGAEITLEANPSSVEAARFRGYRAAGVNRVSLGVQSLDDAQLRALGRLHTAAEALAAIEVARETFERFSFDLIYARPGQTLGGLARASWRRRWRSPAGTCRSTSSPSSRARRSPSSTRAASSRARRRGGAAPSTS